MRGFAFSPKEVSAHESKDASFPAAATHDSHQRELLV